MTSTSSLDLARRSRSPPRARAGRRPPAARRTRGRRPAASRSSPAPTDGAMWHSRMRPALVDGQRRTRRRGSLDPRVMARAAAARKRGSSARPAGTRSPITRPIVARTSGRAASRRAAYSNRAGRPRNAWTSHETASLARNRRASPGRRPRTAPVRAARRCAEDRGGRELGRDERAVEALAGERVEEPGRVADQEPARPGAAGHAMPSGAGAGDGVAAARRRARRPGRRRSAGSRPRSRRRRRRAPRPGEAPAATSGPSTIPTLTRPPGTGAIPT